MQSRFILNLLAIIIVMLALVIVVASWQQLQPEAQTAHLPDSASQESMAAPESSLTTLALDLGWNALVRR